MEKTVYIMCGPSGCGKSTLTKRLVDEIEPHGLIVSADHYFINDRDGIYKFDPKFLANAHNHSLYRFNEAVTRNKGLYSRVVVDNTNTTIAEIAPYYALAQAYGWKVIIMMPLGFMAGAERYSRINIHNVHFGAVSSQIEALVTTLSTMPDWWKSSIEWFEGS